MFVINEDNSIYLTRGDYLFFDVKAKDNGEQFQFQPGSVLRVTVYEEKACENVVLQKDFPVFEDTDSVAVVLEKEETKFGSIISKPKNYWYEVVYDPYNKPQTIIGYSEDGPALFRLFPEGKDIEGGEFEEGDFPYVDEELDMTSKRPVENQAIASAVARLEGSIKDTNEALSKAADNALSKTGGTMTGGIEMSGKKITGLGNPTENGDAVNLQYAKENFAPDQYVAELFSLETEADFEAKINEIYNNLAYNTCRTFIVNLNTSGNYILRGSWFVTICRFTVNYGYVEITNENYGSMIRRNREGWLPWESETPPMVFGVEYRTTERWNGSVVYTKFIDYGKRENNAFLAAPSDATRIVRHIGSFGPFLMPVGEKGEANYAYLVSAIPNVGLTLKCQGVGDYTTYVQLWYIKD